MQNWQGLIFSNETDFEFKVHKIFDYQFKHNEVYRRFCEALGQSPDSILCHPACPDSMKELVSESEAQSKDKLKAQHRAFKTGKTVDSIPLLPIQAFKDGEVVTVADHSEFRNQNTELTFLSSGTEGIQRSRHYVKEARLYRTSLIRGFQQFYDLDNAVIWGYTPGYSENPHSSLVWMINELIKKDDSGLSRFLPLGKKIVGEELKKVEQSGKRLILFGAAFGLLDLAEMSNVTIPSDSVIIETGGMKTHRREISRGDLHRQLARGFGVSEQRIHSEYGMTELLSQAYATGGQWFRTVPWMRVSIRNPENPGEELPPYREGLIGVIDLANVHSCSFILTGDKGMMDKENRFQVLGRWNPKDLRGCNFLIEED